MKIGQPKNDVKTENIITLTKLRNTNRYNNPQDHTQNVWLC